MGYEKSACRAIVGGTIMVPSGVWVHCGSALFIYTQTAAYERLRSAVSSFRLIICFLLVEREIFFQHLYQSLRALSLSSYRPESLLICAFNAP